MLSNQEILEKAIKKAQSKGYTLGGAPWGVIEDGAELRVDLFDAKTRRPRYLSSAQVIFNHEFCKALWGEEWIDTGTPDGRTWKEENIEELAWQYHLQEMVIAEAPIKYLGENI